jgi:hypothetical protein
MSQPDFDPSNVNYNYFADLLIFLIIVGIGTTGKSLANLLFGIIIIFTLKFLILLFIYYFFFFLKKKIMPVGPNIGMSYMRKHQHLTKNVMENLL